MKSIIKWVGGKTQLLSDITNNLPKDTSTITTYIEPFIGSASVFMNIINKFPNIKNVVLGDLNPVLINLYSCIKNNPDNLISILDDYINEFKISNNKETHYIILRDKFNELKQSATNEYHLSASFIILNKTCFNGLYRENSKGLFNVPFNKKLPVSFYDKDDIYALSTLLNSYNVTLVNDSYIDTVSMALDNNSFVYFDPPYRPLNKTSAFTAYTKSGFNDNNQKDLKTICDDINNKGSYFMLSNSDPHNTDPNDNFFDDLYLGYNIQRVYASRSINSKGDKRGKITELLIKNYGN